MTNPFSFYPVLRLWNKKGGCTPRYYVVCGISHSYADVIEDFAYSVKHLIWAICFGVQVMLSAVVIIIGRIKNRNRRSYPTVYPMRKERHYIRIIPGERVFGPKRLCVVALHERETSYGRAGQR